MTTRREMLVAFGLSALAVSMAALAQQQGKVWRVGYLSNRPPVGPDAELYAAFVQGMRDLGYFEGKNLVIERRASERTKERAALAAELVQSKMDVIVATGAQPIRSAQQATARIPIVGISVAESGVKSLARPGGNLTGTSSLTPDLSHKHLEMLLSVRPKLARVAVLVDPDSSIHMAILESVRVAAKTAGVHVVAVEARSVADIAPAYTVAVREKA